MSVADERPLDVARWVETWQQRMGMKIPALVEKDVAQWIATLEATVDAQRVELVALRAAFEQVAGVDLPESG